jgi:hypothetical protein
VPVCAPPSSVDSYSEVEADAAEELQRIAQVRLCSRACLSTSLRVIRVAD